MKFYAYHGVMPQERKVGNNFIVNLTVAVALSDAMKSDNLEDTINYAEIYNVVYNEMMISSQLLEHVAGRILKSLKEVFPQIEEIDLEIAKLNPPFGADIRSASVVVNEKL